MKKRTAVIIISVLSAIIVAVGAFAIYQNRKLVFSARVNQIYGERALNDLTESLSAMEEALQKSKYATSAPLISRLYTDAATYASSAVTALGGLPYSTYELEKTSRFINAAGDYVLYLSRAASEGELPDEEAAANIVEMTKTLAMTSEGFSQVRQALADNALTMDEYGACSDDGLEDTVGCELQVVEEKMPDFPELIYDGALSSPEDGEDEAEEISESKAKRTAALFLGVPEQRLTLAGKSDNGLPCLYFSLSTEQGEEEQIAVTKKSGDVAKWSNSHRPESGNVTEDEAAATAAEFLAERGYDNMKELSRQIEGGICELSFIYSQNGVLCLDDIIMVSVALDDGKVCSMMADKYLKNHKERDLTPAVSPEDAANALPDSLEPVDSRLVLTHMAGTKEYFCYEITCKSSEDEDVVVFVDALTGEQKMIEFLGVRAN